MKIPFDIKFRPQIESGEYKVETRDGKPTRIVCWDLKGNEDFFILALVEKNEKEVSYCYPVTGCCKAACDPEGKDDLFLVTPEPELSEFENKLRVICEDAVRESQLFPERTSEDFAKKHSAELLAIAKKEFIKQCYIIEKKAFHDAVEKVSPEVMKEVSENATLSSFIADLWNRYPEVSFAKLTRIAKAAYDFGKAEALKDLPRWRKWENGACGNGEGIPLAIVKRRHNGYKLVDALGVQGEQYIMLSDIEKLPGLKED